uniref:Dihydrofolate synthase/folylpolyglutamate synthase n=1 Tax=Desulfatirhabdium butyrativorans TaxID=340467 RepID=A0A7C4VRG1_9BACT
MYNLRRFGVKLELGTIRRMLAGLGNPQDSFKTIHIAGTNGKGSVAATLYAILMEAGYSVGLYTSPHLVQFNERIAVDGQLATDEEILEAYLSVRSISPGEREPTFFEYTTAMAFSVFAKRHVDWVVVETGMGGRMDATNVIVPVVSIITNVGLEHQQYLGRTLEEIAWEKGGIIKKGVPVVTGASQPKVLSVLQAIADIRKCELYRLKKDFNIQKNSDGTISYRGMDHAYPNLELQLIGDHQLKNAALSIATCELLRDRQVLIDERAIREGLRSTRWPGRLEIVRQSPELILDGAHNLDAARTLAKHLETAYAGRDITLVIGILSDKPYEKILKILVPLCKRVICTKPKIDRALPVETIENISRKIVSDVITVPKVDRAVQTALQKAKPNDVICVAGSLYVVGEAKAYLDGVRPTMGPI